jgi:uncharacterized protein
VAKDKAAYDCSTCKSWCCSYDRIQLSKAEAGLIADHLQITQAEMLTKWTRPDPHAGDDTDLDENGEPLILFRRKDDPGVLRAGDKPKATVCLFLDLKTRRCGIYEARPATCRDFPGKKCEFYEFSQAVKKRHGDDSMIVRAQYVFPPAGTE